LLKEGNKFNIFEILRKSDDEVHLHSRFISELLNPKGEHGFKHVFLELFLKELKIENLPENNLNKAIVHSEKYIGEISKDSKTGGRIDLLIENILPAITIENKLNAPDQKNQLLRYFNYNKNGELFYLTLKGDEPSDKALGDLPLEKIRLISYQTEINNWLTKCIEKSSKKPSLRESIIQYQQLVNKLTGNSTNMEERTEIVKLISEKENVFNAKKIAENWIHVRWHCEMNFWNDFKAYIEKNSTYKILERQKYSSDALTSVIHQSRNRNPWYGITVKILNYKDSDVYFMIERGFGNLYYGIKVEDEKLLPEISNMLSEKLEINKINKFWAGGRDLKPEINFENFSNDSTLLLCNEKSRMESIKNYWVELTRFIEECKKAIK
jgi:hypothetical protein